MIITRLFSTSSRIFNRIPTAAEVALENVVNESLAPAAPSAAASKLPRFYLILWPLTVKKACSQLERTRAI